ncbi:hypothetical protein C2845_PM07G34580 [Panicum miliaceum]|uniref:Uncharacterized protein n=1 Tax=Panicum miliaceum TaxID=4540 RepID=A0A3L6SR43_PANMI|nr:hypothetical protein C2845_PM07G34580 [Panicum miliaceum]
MVPYPINELTALQLKASRELATVNSWAVMVQSACRALRCGHQLKASSTWIPALTSRLPSPFRICPFCPCLYLSTQAARRRGDGARGGGGVSFLCPFCGYTFPISELHSGHFKICRKRISTASTEEGAGVLGDRGLLLENVDRRNDNGTNLVDLTSHEINDMHTVNEQDEDIDAGTSSCKMSAAQSMFTQDLSSHETVVKNEELTPETSTTDRDNIVTTLATENSEKEWSVTDGDPSCPAASSEQLQDVASSVLPADPENAVRFSSEIPEYEVQTLSVVSLASYATTVGISEQTMVDSELDDIAVAKENGISDAMGKNKPSEVNPVKGNEFGLFQQDNQQTKIGEGCSTTLVEEDSSDNNVNVIRNEETLNGEIESKQQSTLMLANPVENFPIIVGTDLDLLKVGTGSCYSAPEIVEPQQQHNCTSVTEDHLAIPKEADNVYGNPITDGGISAISSVIAPSADGIVVSVGGAPNIKDNDCLYGAIGDITKRNVISSTAMPSQCELVEFSTCMMAQNEKVCLCQDKEQNKEVTADLVSPEVIAETSASTSSSIVLLHEGSTDTLEHMRGRGVLLETPTGFAVFIVKEPLDTEGITCCDDDGVAGDLLWGLKNVLGQFIPEEKHSITKEYHFPLSKGWNDFLLKYSISVPATVRNSYLMSKFFLLRSLHLTLERVPKNLRESFDKRVNGIGNHIKDNFMYVLVLARILVPDLTPDYNFSKIFSSDMVLKIEEAKRFASNYQEERLTLYDRQIILGALDQLGVVPGQIESVVAFIKLRLKEIEVPTRRDEGEKMTTWKDGHGEGIMQNEKRSIWHPIVGLLVFGGIVMQMPVGCGRPPPRRRHQHLGSANDGDGTADSGPQRGQPARQLLLPVPHRGTGENGSHGLDFGLPQRGDDFVAGSPSDSDSGSTTSSAAVSLPWPTPATRYPEARRLRPGKERFRCELEHQAKTGESWRNDLR